MNRRVWLAFILVAFVGILFSWSLLTAQGPRSPHAVPEGFGGEYVLIEKQDGAFVLLHKPQIRSLAGKHYLVGSTIPVRGVTDDELFAPTSQWIDLKKVRRMGEVADQSVIGEIRGIADRMKHESPTK